MLYRAHTAIATAASLRRLCICCDVLRETITLINLGPETATQPMLTICGGNSGDWLVAFVILDTDGEWMRVESVILVLYGAVRKSQ
jgi:hypothetical protein